MKHAQVKLHYLHGEVAEYILIEDGNDLDAYDTLLQNAAGNQIEKCLKSPLFPEHVDHMLGGKDVGTQLLAVAHIESGAAAIQMEGKYRRGVVTNPLYYIERAASRKIDAFAAALVRGNKVLVNNAGGYMLHVEGMTEIINVFEKDPKTGAPNDVLVAGSKWIVLENDWTLPTETKNFFAKQAIPYSVVYDLRGHSKPRLVAVLKQHRANGGDSVFVHTTGLDVPQMFEYTDAIIEAGLSTLVLHFVGGRTERHVDYFKKYMGIRNRQAPKLHVRIISNLEGKLS